MAISKKETLNFVWAQNYAQTFSFASLKWKSVFKRRRFTAVIVYLDDFFIKADTFRECIVAYNITISLIRKLRFYINWNKVVYPSTKITLLGTEIDTISMCLRLPHEKRIQVREELFHFQSRKRATNQKAAAIPSWET